MGEQKKNKKSKSRNKNAAVSFTAAKQTLNDEHKPTAKANKTKNKM